MYYNKDSQQKDRERDILILIGMQGTIIAYLLVHLCRRMMEKKKWTGSQGGMSRLYSKHFFRPIKNYFQTI